MEKLRRSSPGAPPAGRPPAQRPPGSRAGFSLTEALFALLLLTVSVGGLVRAISASSLAGRSAADTGLATRLARARLDRLHAAPLTRSWPLSGYHPAVAPGGSVDTGGAGTPGYVEYRDEDGGPADRSSAFYEVRWRISELVPAGANRLAGLRFEVVALPAGGRRGPVVRFRSLRVANGE